MHTRGNGLAMEALMAACACRARPMKGIGELMAAARVTLLPEKCHGVGIKNNLSAIIASIAGKYGR